jgi:hypothetical protein
MTPHPRIAALAATVCLALSAALAAPARAQTTTPAAASEATLVVAGDVTQPLTIKPADLKTMPRTTVTVHDSRFSNPWSAGSAH